MIRYSADAKKRQEELKELGFYKGVIDGLFGRESKKAERDYLVSIGKLEKQPKSERLTLRQHRCGFSYDFSRLITHCNSLGMDCAIDDVKSIRHCGVHMVGSQHEKGLAGDLLLYVNGEYQRKTEDHAALGKYWESLSPYNRWGGRYRDGNHYERLQWLWREE